MELLTNYINTVDYDNLVFKINSKSKSKVPDLNQPSIDLIVTQPHPLPLTQNITSDAPLIYKTSQIDVDKISNNSQDSTLDTLRDKFQLKKHKRDTIAKNKPEKHLAPKKKLNDTNERVISKKYQLKRIYYERIKGGRYKVCWIDNLNPLKYIIFYDYLIPFDSDSFSNSSQRSYSYLNSYLVTKDIKSKLYSDSNQNFVIKFQEKSDFNYQYNTRQL